jgi:bifunctional DNA-binding transcriptional regulator/antitoxin component of YhaV-PrlF toxin-antitoxin module
MAHTDVAVPQESYVLQLGDRGRLVLPSRLRKRLAHKNGEELVLTLDEDGAMRLTTRRQRLNKLQGMFASIQPHRRLSDELIRERRQEVRRESK